MTVSGFNAMLAAKVDLHAPVFGREIRVHPDFPLSNKKMRAWYLHMKKVYPAGMAALKDAWSAWQTNQGHEARTPESDMPNDDTLQKWIDTYIKGRKGQCDEGECRVCCPVSVHIAAAFNACTWLIVSALFETTALAFAEFRKHSADLYTMFWEEWLARKTKRQCLVPDVNFLWLLRAWLVCCLLANDTPTVTHRPTCLRCACRWLTDSDAAAAYAGGKDKVDETFCNNLYAFLCKLASGAATARAAARDPTKQNATPVEGHLMFW